MEEVKAMDIHTLSTWAIHKSCAESFSTFLLILLDRSVSSFRPCSCISSAGWSQIPSVQCASPSWLLWVYCPLSESQLAFSCSDSLPVSTDIYQAAIKKLLGLLESIPFKNLTSGRCAVTSTLVQSSSKLAKTLIPNTSSRTLGWSSRQSASNKFTFSSTTLCDTCPIRISNLMVCTCLIRPQKHASGTESKWFDLIFYIVE